MKQEDAEQQEEKKPEKSFGLAKKLSLVFVLAVAGFVAFDGYINKWALLRSLTHYNQLQIRRFDGSPVILKANSDFQLVRIDDTSRLLNPDSLARFDSLYRENGLVRIYFRMSDSSSAKMERLYQAVARFDTTESIKHSIEDARRNYQKLLRALKIDTTAASDSLKRASLDSSKRVVETGMTGSDSDFSTAMGRLLKNPQLAIGAGIGVVAAFGIDLLHGYAYVAVAREALIPVDSIRLGAEAGQWEGNPIDILWAFGKPDTSQHARQKK